MARTDPPLAEAYPDALRTWELTAKDDPHVVEERLREAFRDAPVIPDYAGELRGFGEQALFDGALAKASRWLELSHALYPQDTRTTLALAHVRYAGGDHARGDLMMTAVVDLPGGEDLLKPSRLKYAAWRLEKAGFKPAGRDLVAWGARHHQNPELFRLLANKRAALGDKAGAAEAWKNAKAAKAAKSAAPSKR